MKKNIIALLLCLTGALTVSSCKKSEANYDVGPQLQIVFDDNIDKVTADYQVGTTLNLKVAAEGANTISIVSTYPTGTVRTANLGTFPVVNGVALVSVQVNSLRATGDGAPIGAGTVPPVSSRAANTYTLAVDATAGAVTERRFFTAVLVR
ncbi:MAG TPA: hypothetical protein VF598_10245 [Hymenobacter sp.]